MLGIRRKPWIPVSYAVYKIWIHVSLDLDTASFYRWDSIGLGETQTLSLMFFSFEGKGRVGVACPLIFPIFFCFFRILDSPLASSLPPPTV